MKGESEITVTAGTELKLNAADSYDPDGGEIYFKWEFYKEPGSYGGELQINGSEEDEASIMIPDIDSKCTIHIVLSVSDDGCPSLTRYHRFIMTVIPK